jgi:hypothetical protein
VLPLLGPFAPSLPFRVIPSPLNDLDVSADLPNGRLVLGVDHSSVPPQRWNTYLDNSLQAGASLAQRPTVHCVAKCVPVCRNTGNRLPFDKHSDPAQSCELHVTCARVEPQATTASRKTAGGAGQEVAALNTFWTLPPANRQ